MDTELQKLRIDKNKKAIRPSGGRTGGSALPWMALVALLLGGGSYIGWNAWGASRPVVVQVMPVVMPEGAVTETDLVQLQATGYIIAAHKIEVASKVIGRVAWVGVERGDKVKKDQVVVKLEDEEYQARRIQQQGMLDSARAKLEELEAGSRPEAIAQAKADWDVSLAELENAEINLKRLQELMPTRAVSRQDFDDAEALVRSRRARAESVRQTYMLVKAGPRKEEVAAQRAVVKQMEGGLRGVEVELANTIIKAPVDGTILQRNVEVGEFVTTGFVGDNGAKGYVVSLADLTDLRVELDISQNDFAKTRLGQPCWITTDAYPDRKYEGVVDLISPEADRTKATVGVRVKITSPDDLLRPDMNATVSFLNEQRLKASQPVAGPAPESKPVLRIPATALRDGNTVFVVDKGKATTRTLTLGASQNGQVEVRKGLSGGEELIVNPPPSLKADMPVEVR